MSEQPKIYLAAPLFNEMERDFNLRLAAGLEQSFEVFLPQRDGGLLADLVKRGVAPSRAEKMVFQRDVSAIEDSDFVVAVLDGSNVDEGVAFEVGFAFARGKRCIGFQTDMRRQLPTGNNPMLSASLHAIHSNINDLMQSLLFLADGLMIWRHKACIADHQIVGASDCDS